MDFEEHAKIKISSLQELPHLLRDFLNLPECDEA